MANERMNGNGHNNSSSYPYDVHLDPRSVSVPHPLQQPQQQPYPYEGQPLLKKNYPGAQDMRYHWDDEDESETERQEACRGMTVIAVFLFTVVMGLRYLTAGLAQHQFSNPTTSSGTGTGTTGTGIPLSTATSAAASSSAAKQKVPSGCPNGMAFCEAPAKHQVSTNKKGFPSFWNYAPGGPMNVSYDGRSLLINGDRALFLSGSIHPIRTTKETWDLALDQAVHNGLNMVTIYVFWAEHQPFPDQDIDWTLPAGQGPNCDTNNPPSYCGWSLAMAIRSAASRGLFVHARIGPYVCAEYNYGGIPEWVALHKPNIAMRRLNSDWLQAMEAYVKSTVQYFQQNRLFAYQGGPIVMAQIENELGEEDDDNNIPMMDDDVPPLDASDANAAVSEDTSSRRLHVLDEDEPAGSKVTVQDYADWCGNLAEQVAPRVIWTMCNGLTANNTILTCNGDCSTSWLEDYGTGSGRIQKDQPAIWTEDEGGFQLWGDDSSAPSDYFWGRTARAMAYDTLRWFARGGSHLNYYMWWGGYNRRRASAAGIMNGYATDAAVCPSGHPREPKFSHFQALHKAIHHIAPILLSNPSAMKHSIEIQEMNEEKEWIFSGKQRMFVYKSDHKHKSQSEISFVENDSREKAVVKIPLKQSEDKATMVLTMNPQSVVLLVDGTVKFDSFTIDKDAMSYRREIEPAPVNILGWSSCAEPIGPAKKEKSLTLNSTKPKEQTALNIDAKVYSDYAWYETHLDLDESLDEATIFVESQIGSAMVLFIDGEYIGDAFTLQHAEGNVTFQFQVGHLKHGRHKLAFLSESLGYHNLIGRWGAKTGAKTKGITGDVLLASGSNGNMSIVDGRAFKSHPGLNGHVSGYCRDVASDRNHLPHPTWSSAMFNTPDYDPTTHALYLNITHGRGHLWLNGHDLGRFWNITRGDTKKYSQQYYFLPPDLLEADGSVNKIVFFDALGSNELRISTTLILSYLKHADSPNFKDQVDFDGACL